VIVKTEQLTATVQGLREFADFLEAHQNFSGDGVYGRPRIEIEMQVSTEAQLKSVARDFGSFEKHPDKLPDYYYGIEKQFAGLWVTVRIDREKVCRKVTTMVPKETWECPESLLAPDEAEAQVALGHEEIGIGREPGA
jgi:hypothetical protein